MKEKGERRETDIRWSSYVGTFPGPARQVVLAPCTFRWCPVGIG